MSEKDFLKEVIATMQAYLEHLQDPIDVTRYMQTIIDASVRMNSLNNK